MSLLNGHLSRVCDEASRQRAPDALLLESAAQAREENVDAPIDVKRRSKAEQPSDLLRRQVIVESETK